MIPCLAVRYKTTNPPHEPIPPETERIAKEIVDAAVAVHRALGPGLLESVYEACLDHELKSRGIAVRRQVQLPVEYKGVQINAGCDWICSWATA